MLQQVKRMVPKPVKQRAKHALQDYQLGRAMRRIMQLPAGDLPSRKLLSELQTGWGNDSFAARYDYLEEVMARASEATGPILECGSGLTTFLLGLYAGRRGVETWSLEHLPEWHERVSNAVRRWEIPGTNVCLAPLREYGEFHWYDLRLDQMPERFSLVVCDGPPGTTRGGRYGLLAVLGERIRQDAVILLDDADREAEAEVLERWAAERKATVTLRASPTGTFAVVNCGS